MARLEVKNIDVSYGQARVLRNVSIAAGEGEIVCVIGANGAGKSTLLRAISGLLRVTAGTILYNGANIENRPPRQIVQLGIAHSPEGRRIFAGLTVEENLEVASASWRGLGQSIASDLRHVYEIFPRLEERRRQLGWSMSGGEQQMLAIGRALMAHPRLLLLDEPSLGLAPLIVRDVFNRIREVNRGGTTILLVEQSAKLAVDISDRGYLLENGEVILEGAHMELAADTRVKAAYLGA
ncbi:MAG: ABC transporter ATP-binding protein [Candidatus Binatia bacterium]